MWEGIGHASLVYSHQLCDSHGVNAQTAFAAISGVLFHSGFGGQLLNLRLGENGVGLSQGRPASASASTLVMLECIGMKPAALMHKLDSRASSPSAAELALLTQSPADTAACVKR